MIFGTLKVRTKCAIVVVFFEGWGLGEVIKNSKSAEIGVYAASFMGLWGRSDQHKEGVYHV